jgi:hypothetical protein
MNLDLIIKHANQLVTMNSKFGVPRRGKYMSELAIIENGALAIKDYMSMRIHESRCY